MKSFCAIILCSILITSCRNEDDKYGIGNLNDSTSISGLTGDSIKLVKTANVTLKVKDVQQSTLSISELAKNMGGLITHQKIEATEDETSELKVSNDSVLKVTAYTTRAEMKARIPEENLTEFMYAINNQSYFVASSNMDIDDKSLDYLALQLRQQNRVPLLTQQSNKNQRSATTMQLLNTKDEITDQEILKRAIDANVQYSTVELSLFQNPLIRKEMMANYTVADYQLPFRKNISNAFSVGWAYFLKLLVALTYYWVFILLGIATWLVYRYNKKRTGLVKG